MKRNYEFFTHKNGVIILENDCIFWFDSLETFLDEELNQTNGSSCRYENEKEARREYEQEKLKAIEIEYTMKDLRSFMNNLEEWQLENFKENEEEIYIVIGNEDIIINKLTAPNVGYTVTSSFGNYNSIHDIVEDLLTR